MLSSVFSGLGAGFCWKHNEARSLSVLLLINAFPEPGWAAARDCRASCSEAEGPAVLWARPGGSRVPQGKTSSAAPCPGQPPLSGRRAAAVGPRAAAEAGKRWALSPDGNPPAQHRRGG